MFVYDENRHVRVWLDEAEIERLFWDRNPALKRAVGVVDYQVTKRHSGREIEILGIKGELAVANLLGLDVQTGIGVHGDGGVDLARDGHTFGVKATDCIRRPPRLFVSPSDWHEKKINDYLVLAVCFPDGSVVLAGWVTRQQYIDLGVDGSLAPGYPVNHLVRVDQLEPMKDLLALFPAPTPAR